MDDRYLDVWMCFYKTKTPPFRDVSFDEPLSVTLPVCTHIRYDDVVWMATRYNPFSVFQPLLSWRGYENWGLSEQESGKERSTLGLLPTRRLLLQHYHPTRLESLAVEVASLVELEVLMIKIDHLKPITALLSALGRTITEIGVLASRSTDVTLDRNAYGGDAGTFSRGPRSLICPNLTQLALRIFREASASEREQISWQCEQMMDARRSAGQELECCCIWWGQDKTPSLVLGTSRNGVLMEW
jgi:hypothetical protein